MGTKMRFPVQKKKTMGFYSMEQRGQILESEERTPAYSTQYDCEEQSGQPRREEADFWMSQNEYGQESESEDYDRESPELKTSPEYGYRQSSQGYCPEYQNPYGGYADRYNPMPPQGDFWSAASAMGDGNSRRGQQNGRLLFQKARHRACGGMAGLRGRNLQGRKLFA